MQDHLFTSDLVALRKRRANVARNLAMTSTRLGHFRRGVERRQAQRVADQFKRTFYALTVIELRLTDKVAT